MKPTTMPKCFCCLKFADELDEYIYGASTEEISILDYVREEEGTYNPKTNTFCCTNCYFEIGAPSLPWPGRWVAPECINSEDIEF